MGESAEPGIAAGVPSPTREDASLQHLEHYHWTVHRSRRVGAGVLGILWPAMERSNPTRRTPPGFGWKTPTRNNPVGKATGCASGGGLPATRRSGAGTDASQDGGQ